MRWLSNPWHGPAPELGDAGCDRSARSARIRVSHQELQSVLDRIHEAGGSSRSTLDEQVVPDLFVDVPFRPRVPEDPRGRAHEALLSPGPALRIRSR